MTPMCLLSYGKFFWHNRKQRSERLITKQMKYILLMNFNFHNIKIFNSVDRLIAPRI